MKRICLFAGYDSKGIIHDYVVYYLKELSTVSEVYYMADNEISDIEKEKIKPYTKGVYGFNHKKYDFGSWQELIKIIGWEKLYEYDELILANDSVFGQLYPMKEFFDIIEKDKEWDVCGINFGICEDEYKNYKYFLNSYFLIFKNKAFISEIFYTFISSIKVEKQALDVVLNYEIKFTELFYLNKYKVKSLIYGEYDTATDFKLLINNGSPFLRKKIFNKEWNKYYPYNTIFLKKYLKHYNQKMIYSILTYENQFYLKDFLKYILKKLLVLRKRIIRINLRDKKIYILGIRLLDKNKKLVNCPILKIKDGQ